MDWGAEWNPVGEKKPRAQLILEGAVKNESAGRWKLEARDECGSIARFAGADRVPHLPFAKNAADRGARAGGRLCAVSASKK